MKKIEYLIIHCSDSEFGDAKIIRRWHTEPPRNWRDIGYHYILLNGKRNNKRYNLKDDGLIEAGRPIDNDIWMNTTESGAHARAYNSKSIGVCLIGKKKFSLRQFESLIKLCEFYMRLIPGIKIIGHCQICDYKTCPNFEIDRLIEVIKYESDFHLITTYLKDYLS